jgi:protein SCO1
VDETKAVARDFKVFFAKVPGKVEGSYTMDHTAGSYVFDTQGRLRLFERYGTAPDALASDFNALINGA